MKYVVNNVMLQPDDSEREIRNKIATRLSITPESFRYEIVNRNIEYSDGKTYYLTKAIVDTSAFIRDTRIGFFGPVDSLVIQPTRFKERPIIVGAGIAGLFCAYVLAKAGARPIVLEQGGDFADRESAISEFETKGKETSFPYANGLGGFSGFCGGTVFSDRLSAFDQFALDTFLEFGAPKRLSLDGTSCLEAREAENVVRAISSQITAFGGEILLHKKVAQILTSFGKAVGVRGEDSSGKKFVLKSKMVVLASGNPTPSFLSCLKESKVKLEERPFYFGVMGELPFKEVCQAVYHSDHVPDGLPMFRFVKDGKTSSGRENKICCLFPGGKVVDYSSMPGEVLIEGGFPNSGSRNVLVSLLLRVDERDKAQFQGSNALGFLQNFYGSLYQSSNPFYAPVETIKDFLSATEPLKLGKVKPTYKPGVYLLNIASTCPSFLRKDMDEVVTSFRKNFPGCNSGDNLILGFTCGKTSPIGVWQDEDFHTSLKGLRAALPPACKEETVLDEASRGIACAFSILNRD